MKIIRSRIGAHRSQARPHVTGCAFLVAVVKVVACRMSQANEMSAFGQTISIQLRSGAEDCGRGVEGDDAQ